MPTEMQEEPDRWTCRLCGYPMPSRFPALCQECQDEEDKKDLDSNQRKHYIEAQ